MSKAFLDVQVLFYHGRILEIAKAMRLKVTKTKDLDGLGGCKLATLSLPLPSIKMPVHKRKRNMT